MCSYQRSNIDFTIYILFLGDWDPVRVKDTSSPTSFSTLVLNPLKAIQNARIKDDIESLVVRKGCKLEVFKESDCTGAKYTFEASKKIRNKKGVTAL